MAFCTKRKILLSRIKDDYNFEKKESCTEQCINAHVRYARTRRRCGDVVSQSSLRSDSDTTVPHLRLKTADASLYTVQLPIRSVGQRTTMHLRSCQRLQICHAADAEPLASIKEIKNNAFTKSKF